MGDSMGDYRWGTVDGELLMKTPRWRTLDDGTKEMARTSLDMFDSSMRVNDEEREGRGNL